MTISVGEPASKVRLRQAAEQIRRDLEPYLLSVEILDGATVGLEVQPADLLAVAKYLKENPELNFNYLSCLSGVDRISHMEVVYHIHSLPNNITVQIRVKLDRARPTVDSVASLWPTANWHEREAFDLMGIDFPGHPDLRRILLAEDFQGWPLRKDYISPWRRGQ